MPTNEAPFSSERVLPSTPFAENMRQAMTDILQEIFESDQLLTSINEEHFPLHTGAKTPTQIQNEYTIMKRDLRELQACCRTIMQESGQFFKNRAKKREAAVPKLATDTLAPLQEHLQARWSQLQKCQDRPPEDFTSEVSEMQTWVILALKQVEKSLDLLKKLPSK